MIIAASRALTLLVFIVLCALIDDVLGAGKSSKKSYALPETEPQVSGNLQVKVDWPLVANKWPNQSPSVSSLSHHWVTTSHIKSIHTTLSDGQLLQLAIDAYGEMVDAIKAYGASQDVRPSAMTALAFDDEVILASSQKGYGSYSFDLEHTPVYSVLKLCQLAKVTSETVGKLGGNQAMCGQVTALQLYHRQYPSRKDFKGRNARIVTVSSQESTEGNKNGNKVGQVKWVGTCPQPASQGGPMADWGCDEALGLQHVRKIASPETRGRKYVAQPYDIKGAVKGQIRLCQ
ncbi:hypothetical protein BHE90_008711 [Fusarium euwallaceae]|uniref:Uncharacterized protein n=2 Tax=Fusarium solani species complex TaxID=232080 RepID=A0A3M2SFJ5_9HYPO|nr:hypothetical protein CDV36_004321 [Fusarium kuroshium]RTE76819.1 hypothetical protein BHE90_008711 [Fusarium euwallaceae]